MNIENIISKEILYNVENWIYKREGDVITEENVQES